MQKYEYLKAINADYIEELLERYAEDPSSVDESWRYFFEGMEWGTENAPAKSNGANGHAASVAAAPATLTAAGTIDFHAEAKVASLINAYREMGRVLANIDPLNTPPESHPLLEISNFELQPTDLDRKFTAGRLIGMVEKASLREIIARLREVYCASIGVQYTHIQDPESRRWLQTEMESSRTREDLSAEEKRFLLKRLVDAESFERFLHTRYVAQKRFSIEGGESLIPALDRIIEVGAELGVNRLVMGMAHRGRLNVLLNTFGKKAEYIFTEFEEDFEGLDTVGVGDVKYHMGYSSDFTTRRGKAIHLTLANNPSHLEFVNPVVEGIARSKQRAQGDKDRSQVLPILIHGDAAFAGQGVVYETLNLSQISGYRTGGTIHIVLNNQVGFTASPEECRSTTYATDVAKMLEVPIFHVNGDDPEAVYYVARLAVEYRQKFKRDVFIDLVCYRKYGHNEGDDPTYTQPLMYEKIRNRASPREIYARRLLGQEIISEAESQSIVDRTMEALTEAQKVTKTKKPRPFVSSFEDKWKDFHAASQAEVFKVVDTSVPADRLRKLAEKLRTIPDGFNLHPKLLRFVDGRVQAVRDGKGIDWGNAEALAFGSLIEDGHVVRLSGQDCERGTFTHRHSVFNDVKDGRKYAPLNSLAQGDVTGFVVRNSHLSETAVLGFEYGWSLADPQALVIWEAQFGDFVNGAQVILDQFIASSEVKWQRSSGLVLFLPHGYEGQGPEHSSARIERFLQLCAENNISVCNVTTPAQLFHVLRRQMKRSFRKPLVLFTPKSGLRHPAMVSTIDEFAKGSFEYVLDDPSPAVSGGGANVKRVLLCSGKIFFELHEEREKRGLKDTAIVRLEQMYPWPGDRLAEVLARYPKANFTWVQEEPRNMGAWTYVFNQWAGGLENFQAQVGNRSINYVGRAAAAAPANGAHKLHAKTQRKIIESALTIL